MLAGERPSECQYCWNMEDLGHVSDRVTKSAETWANPLLPKIANMTGDENVNPKHMEVSFSNACNLKCSYCNPTVSSKWLEEVKQHGGYNTSTNFNNYIHPDKPLPFILEREDNPYIDAFWKWWPELYNDLEVLRVTGGEPLMSKHTWKIIDYVKDHPRKDLALVINSNLAVPNELINRIIDEGKQITPNLKYFKIFTSIDSWGEQAAYGRNGLDFDTFKNNLERVLKEIPNGRIGITVTFNVLSVPRFIKLAKYILKLRQEHGHHTVTFDTPYLRYPPHQNIQILPPEYASYYDEVIAFMEANESETGFSKLEIDKIKRLKAFMLEGMDVDDIVKYRKDFYIFFSEHDRRRNTDFMKTFPELKQFYLDCKALYENRSNNSL